MAYKGISKLFILFSEYSGDVSRNWGQKRIFKPEYIYIYSIQEAMGSAE